jgi:prepilin-type N-terminal cleavage/methylation domain-containing protein
MKKGFTLIELLVVIAIIGILASVVLVGFGDTRDQARDARIMSAMAQIRNQAEVFYNDNNTYDGMMSADAIVTLVDDIEDQSSDLTAEIAETSVYCVVAPLKTSGSYCVDYTGKAVTQDESTCSAATVCQPE